MWAILLKVLSIIGIVIACIIGAVLVLLLLVLLCPICYRVKGNAHDGKITAKVRLHYLFGLIRAGYDYPEPGNIYARIAWYHLYDSKEPKADNKDDIKDAHKRDNKKDRKEDQKDEIKKEEVIDTDDLPDNTLTEINVDEIPDEVKEETVVSEEPVNVSEPAGGPKTEKKSIKDKKKILNPLFYIKKAWEDFKYKVIAKAKMIYKDVSFYKKLLLHEDTQGLLKLVKRNLIRILKQMRPKYGHADIEYGMDSPDTTAYIFGAYSVVFAKKLKKYVLKPNFEEKMLEGDLEVGGFFNLFGIVIFALPVVFSRKLRKLRARLERHSDNMETCRRKAEKKYNKALDELEKEYSA